MSEAIAEDRLRAWFRIGPFEVTAQCRQRGPGQSHWPPLDLKVLPGPEPGRKLARFSIISIYTITCSVQRRVCQGGQMSVANSLRKRDSMAPDVLPDLCLI